MQLVGNSLIFGFTVWALKSVLCFHLNEVFHCQSLKTTNYIHFIVQIKA